MLHWVLQLRTAQFTAILILPVVVIGIGLSLLLLLRLFLLLDVIVLNILHHLPRMLALLLLQQQLLLVELHLLSHLLANLDPLLEVLQHSALIQEQLEGGLESLAVIRSGRDMYFSLGEDGVLSVHQFVHQHPKGVGVVDIGLDCWITFEFRMIEIWYICFLLELEGEIGVHRHRLPYLRNTVLNIDVTDV